MQEPLGLEDPARMGRWRWLWNYWLARLRLSDRAVCTMSRGRGILDFHDYPDSEAGVPDHFSVLRCKRCQKTFVM